MILPGREDRASETKSWKRQSVYFCCMTRGDENEMLSIYPGVSRIYTPCRSFHLRYPCISVHPPSLLSDILGVGDRSCLEMHREAVIERVWRCSCRLSSGEIGGGVGGRRFGGRRDGS